MSQEGYAPGTCFQFIEFPSEWGARAALVVGMTLDSFQFIEFPSEWGAGNHFCQLQHPRRFPIY